MRNRSFAFPVILIGLGIIFLINNAVPNIPIWNLLGQYWPVLLIVFGLIQVFEVLARFSRGAPVAPEGFRPMGWGWIPLLLVLACVASIPHFLGHRWHHWNPIGVNGVEIFGEQYDYPVSVSSPAGSAQRVVLDNLRGSITVTGSEDNEIHLEGHKNIRALDRDAARQTNDRTRITVTPEENAIFIRAVQVPGDGPHDGPGHHPEEDPGDSPANGKALLSVDLEITLPKGVSLEARGRSGDLTVNQMNGSVDVTSQKGEIRLNDLGGDARLEVENCDLVRAANVKGSINVQGNGRDLQLDHIAGLVTIGGRFSGTLDFRNLLQPLHFESEQTDLRVEKLPGSINMDLGELRAQNVVGPVRLVTHSRDVHLDDFTGPVDIDLGRGDVDLKPASGQLSRMDVRSREGNIEMALPPKGDFDLRAATDQGEVSNDYGDAVVSDTQGRAASLKSLKPAGPAIVLNTTRGEISVRKLE